MPSDFAETEYGSPADLSAGDAPSLTVDQAIANLRGSDLGLRYYAAWWLGRFRVSTPEAVDALIESLSDESDRTAEGGYPLRRNSARALGKLGDRRAVPALIECLECDDFYVREAAVQSLGFLGDRGGIPALMRLLDGGLATSQPIPGKARLGQPYDAILEALGMLDATESIDLVEPFLNHPFELIQYSAARAMYQLTQDGIYGDRLVQALSSDKLQLRRAVLSDLGAIGYIPAAEAIAQTLVENSLKLFSLRGLLESAVKQSGASASDLSTDAMRVMALMDSLL